MAAPTKAIDQLNNLRAEVRSLGGTLGRTIAALEGESAGAGIEGRDYFVLPRRTSSARSTPTGQ